MKMKFSFSYEIKPNSYPGTSTHTHRVRSSQNPIYGWNRTVYPGKTFSLILIEIFMDSYIHFVFMYTLDVSYFLPYPILCVVSLPFINSFYLWLSANANI